MTAKTIDGLVAVGLRRRRWLRIPGLGSAGSMRLGLIIVGLLIIMAVGSHFWTPYDPNATQTGAVYASPSWQHLFGTDRVGADVFSRTAAATQTDVGITLAAVAIAFVIGTVLGAISGYFGSVIDLIVMRLMEIFQAFPTLLLAMLIVAAIGRGILNVIVVLAIVGIPNYVRLARAEILSKKSWQFAEAAQMVGNPPLRLLFRHLVPNSMVPLISFVSINASWVAGLVAALGFIGLGIEPGSAEWGSMIAGGKDAIVSGDWWISFFPGIGVLIMSAAFYLISDGLTHREDSR
jgi:peptide/nickel transport system permease protein